ncbi:hypothetical protein BGY98DRAFT_1101064 [Russula aff. rugulosa BPL654]|nr:hypothetical protein BGY98DRAFT_1101064 [Russula aff. rugulosa BPL654]
MSNSYPITTGSSSSNFQLIFNNALKAYEKRTKNDLLAHPLAAELQNCNSPRNISMFFTSSKEYTEKPRSLIEIFGRIESFFRRLSIYTQVPSTPEMLDTIIQILVEVLMILGIATKEMKQGRIKKYGKRLIGKTDMEDALKKLDRLTQENSDDHCRKSKGDACVDERVERVLDRVGNVNDKVAEVICGVRKGNKQVMKRVEQNQLRDCVHKWLSPPDPSTNHNIACATHHKKAATWFFQGNIYKEWKSKGSLMWIHGKPGSGKSILCSTVIEDIKALCDASQASMGYFYFDFRNANKQCLRDLLPSLLTQLSARSSPRCDILSELYSAHDDGKNQPVTVL